MWISSEMLRVAMAIASVESGLDPFAIGDGGASMGLLQIGQSVIQDVNNNPVLRFEWPTDAMDPKVAVLIMYLYMEAYNATGVEDAAALWNGGPSRRAKRDYVERVANVYHSLSESQAQAMMERVLMRWKGGL